MTGDVLLDTNIVSAILEGDPALEQRAKSVAGRLHLPSIVVGELYYGAQNSTRRQENLRRTDEFVASVNILPADGATGRHFGDVKFRLRERGKPIPENDIWIAAIALQHDLSLATRDAHFGFVEKLRTVAW